MSKKPETPSLSYALIGCGRVSVKHIKAVLKKNSGYRLVAIVDTNPEAPRNLLHGAGLSDFQIDRLFMNVKLYTDYEEMLAAEKPQVAAITVPSGLHY